MIDRRRFLLLGTATIAVNTSVTGVWQGAAIKWKGQEIVEIDIGRIFIWNTALTSEQIQRMHENQCDYWGTP